MNHDELGRRIYKESHLTGTFRLRSGKISNKYFDKYLFESNPAILMEIARELASLLPAETEVIAGLELGGVPLATALSIITHIPVVFVRKKAKDYGTCKLAEGIDVYGKRTCIVEDVVTSGGQVILSSNDLVQCGAKVGNVLCVIERESAGRENMEKHGLTLTSLFSIDELTRYA